VYTSLHLTAGNDEMLTFLAIDVIKKVDAVFHNTVAHIAVVTTHRYAHEKYTTDNMVIG